MAEDPRVAAVLLAGSAIDRSDDAFSDVDLVVVCREERYEELLADRLGVAASLGNLLAAFTGEHVGEPRLLICLYADPLLHVDLKFVTAADLKTRVETPLVLFDRAGSVPGLLAAGTAAWPAQSPEWFEERFWIWVHYGAAKIARGELFEALDMLSFLRAQVLGALLARNCGKRQRGARLLEFVAPKETEALAATVARYEREDCWRALAASVELYRRYRDKFPPENARPARENAVISFVERLRADAQHGATGAGREGVLSGGFQGAEREHGTRPAKPHGGGAGQR